MFRISSVAGCFILAAGGAAMAQESELRVDTVIVTSPGPERVAGELLSNVTAVDREELVADLQGTLGDTLSRQPGVSTTYFGAGASRPVMRGLGAERVLVLTNGLGVIDASAASPDHQTGTDGLDAERIEILRGPAALAYGGQAIGGVVNVIDGLIVETLPEDGFEGQAFGAFNSVNDGSEFAGRGRFVVDDFVLSVSAGHRDFDDYDIPGFAESERLHEAEGHEDHDEHEEHEEHEEEEEGHEEEAYGTLPNSFLTTDTLGAGLSWVHESGYIGVAVRHQVSDYGLPGHSHGHEEEGEEDHDDHAHEEEAHEAAYIDLEQTRIDLQAGWRFNHDVLNAIEARFTSADYEHAEFEGPGEIGTQYFTQGYEGRVELDHTLFGFSGAAGVQFFDTDFRAEGEEVFITPTQSNMQGVFLYETREWASGFGIEGGVRWEQVERENDLQGVRDFDLMSSSLGVHQHWENGIFIGAQVALTERAPNESELFANGPHLATDQYEVGNVDLNAETGRNVELTARFLGEYLTLGLNVFRTDFDDFVYLTPGSMVHDGRLTDEVDGLAVYQFVQQDANFAGGELYGNFHFDDGLFGAHWDVNAGIDFVEAELDDGGDVPFIPPVTFNGDVKADWGLFDAGLGVTLANDQTDPGAGSLATDGYAVFDLTAGVTLDQFIPQLEGSRLFLQARNVTDEEIRYATSVLKDQLPVPGRNIRVGFTAEF
ncbi:TonB-dependent receptor [Ponticaulis sp.]|uniref:TonB-dependent receptor n=1 Tax=Ponticaulis sp. TaxID=2020902 RepID=UPI00262993DC|nr:TonB-dependent receptor [Ponticaulis sp.]MDF1680593.1 TonB-dependent receptor [Ponticaulis sp.]